jgi:hypothetical protein
LLKSFAFLVVKGEPDRERAQAGLESSLGSEFRRANSHQSVMRLAGASQFRQIPAIFDKPHPRKAISLAKSATSIT